MTKQICELIHDPFIMRIHQVGEVKKSEKQQYI